MSKSQDLSDFPAGALDIDASGNLDVTGTVTADGLTVDGGALVQSGNTLTLNRTDNATGGEVSYVAGTGFILNDVNGDGTSFNVGAANRMRIDSAGNVGIGTSSPASLLQIQSSGVSTAAVLSITATNSASSASCNSQIKSLESSSGSGSSELSFHTRHVGDAYGSPQEAIRIDSSGRLLINRTTSTGSLNLESQAPSGYSIGSGFYSGSTQSTIEFKDTNTTANYKVRIGSETDDLVMFAGGSERLRIDSAGNLLVGTTTASLPLTVGDRSGAALNYINGTANTVSTDSGIFVSKTTTDDNSVGYGLQLANNANTVGARSPMIGFSALSQSGGYNHLYAGINGIKTSSGSDHNWNKGAIQFSIGGGSGLHEKMRLDPDGNLLLGVTSRAYSERVSVSMTIANQGIAVRQTDNANANDKMLFVNTNGIVGYIRTTGLATAYSTASDYRLKEDDIAMTGATERVKALRPINFAWKADGTRVDGFFAHEVQEVVPEAAQGTKDGMRDEEYEVTPAVYENVITPAVEAVLDEDGVVITEAIEESTESVLVTEAVMATRSVPDYQGIDQSKLVPLLTATIQELIARIEILEAK